MALFPSSPTNGQTTVVNGITYSYDSSQTAWVKIAAGASGDFAAAGNITATSNVTASRFISNVGTGSSPLVVSSTTKVTNLNADLLDGYDTATANTASTVAVRDANGNVSANYFIGNGSFLTGDLATGANSAAQSAYGRANTGANTVAVYANGSSILSSANLNFNNTATINVAVTANGTTQSNIAFSVNTSAVGGGTTASIANGTSNVNIATSGGPVTFGVGGTANVVVVNAANVNTTATLGFAGGGAAEIITTGVNANLTIDPQGTGNLVVTSTTPVVIGNTLTVGTGSSGNITGANLVSSNFVQGFLIPSAGTTGNPPLLLPSSGVLTSATTVGAIEYDGTALYGTENSTTGRGEIGIYQAYRYTTAGSALGPTIADYFPATSSINLEASSFYDIECVAYFLKTTGATVTFTWTNSSAPNLLRSYYVGTAATGFTTTTVTGTPVTGLAVAQAVAAVAHAATGSLTTAVYHYFHFKVFVATNAATNLRFRITSASGTVTPQAGSYYTVRKLSVNAGNFVA